jgi:hypothetical protein
MTVTTTETTLDSKPSTLEQCLLQISTCYQDLLEQPAHLDLCREAGRTVRHLALCLVGPELDGGEEDRDEDDEFGDELSDD